VAPTASEYVAMAIPSSPVEGSRPKMVNVMWVV
jgi:hypothetical protein